ncbi:MAG: bifunctional DNA-formamidopyrimidine glycosylase/DNA-(apurinic or apyrimidinic site) lyase [Candidatus Andersenbacteria bacterium]|nr:bifunctional DNA-formamidopyrimidine glycosylase/DNA-(apurinic or apyrimidinic site) lyase [bacterium]MDZ4225280.1 bifunctional DNA-formamidopyrimidine glycosylase/DNA-(apurinic or apyrimidinic site) lyase [Candidatus Andersenbacteria bacterium]
MPELPEVETIRRDLQKELRGRKIARVEVRKKKMVRGSAGGLQMFLKGKSFSGIRRRGKLLIFAVAGGQRYLLVHLKMTGQLIFVDAKKEEVIAGGHSGPDMEKLPNKYSHIIWHFTDGSVLYFNDLRQFGFGRLVDESALAAVLAAYGVEPLEKKFTAAKLTEILGKRQTTLKSVLLNQALIVGLGNIYVDEACFYAGVRPTRRAGSLTAAEIKQLYRGIGHVLRQSLKHRGTTFNSFRDGTGKRGNFVSKLKVYRRTGEKCKRCKGGIITRVKVSGRGTHFCPACQV